MSRLILNSVIILMLVVCASGAIQAKGFFLPTATMEGIAEAIEFGNQNNEKVTIAIAGEVIVDGRVEFPPIKNTVVLIPVVGSAVFKQQSAANSVPSLFTIESSGDLRIRGMRFEGLSTLFRTNVSPAKDPAPIISNSGRLTISNSVFKDISTVCIPNGRFASTVCSPVIVNSGNAILENVVFQNISAFIGNSRSS